MAGTKATAASGTDAAIPAIGQSVIPGQYGGVIHLPRKYPLKCFEVTVMTYEEARVVHVYSMVLAKAKLESELLAKQSARLLS